MEKINTIITGDNVAVLQTFSDACIDLVVTSPPYDNLRTYGGHSWDFEGVARELTRVLKPGGVIVWVVADATVNGSETLTSMRQAIHFKDVCGLRVHDTMIYEKSGVAFPDSNRYLQNTEFMFVLSKYKPKTVNLIRDRPNKYVGTMGGNKRGGLCTRAEYGIRWNVWRYANGRDNSSKDREAYKHPAIFPDALARDHILSWSNEGDVVLDPFAGSGTTCVAAKELNRNYIGIEINSEYVNICEKRLNKRIVN
jgi:DNA modification methylase